jgi:hypothetical protein
MKKTLAIFFSLSFFFSVAAQDSSWTLQTIDENLKILLPSELTSTVDTAIKQKGRDYRLKAFSSEGEFCLLGITITPGGTGLNVDNEESLKKALDGIARGACDKVTENGYLCQVKDSTIDGMPCRRITMYEVSLESPAVVNYAFLVNDKMYMITAAPEPGLSFLSSFSKEVDRVLAGIHFNQSNVKERRFGSKAESWGYMFGKILIPLLIIIGVIVYVVKRN